MKLLRNFVTFVGAVALIALGLFLFNQCSTPTPDYVDPGNSGPGELPVPSVPASTPTPKTTTAVTDPTAVTFSAAVTVLAGSTGFSEEGSRSEHPSFDVTCQDSKCEASYLHVSDQMDGFAENFVTKQLTDTYVQAVKESDQADPENVTATFSDALTELTTVTYLNNGWPSEGQAASDKDEKYEIILTEQVTSVE